MEAVSKTEAGETVKISRCEPEAYPGELKDLRSDRSQRHALQDRLRYLDHELHRAHQTYHKMLDSREAGAYQEYGAIENLRKQVTEVSAQLLAHTGA